MWKCNKKINEKNKMEKKKIILFPFEQELDDSLV